MGAPPLPCYKRRGAETDAWGRRVRQRFGLGRPAALALLGIAATGCSTGPLGGSTTPSSSPGYVDRFTSLFSSSPSGQEPSKVAGPDPNLDCPTVDVRQGASTIQITATGNGADAGGLRYQVTIARTARECAVVGSTVAIKVGVQGRIILGPAGAPGQIDVPLRLAVVQEGMQPKTIWTRLNKVAVAVPPGQTSVPFAYVEENFSSRCPALAISMPMSSMSASIRT